MKVKDPKDCVKLDRAIFSSHINPTGCEQATYRMEIIGKHKQKSLFWIHQSKKRDQNRI